MKLTESQRDALLLLLASKGGRATPGQASHPTNPTPLTGSVAAALERRGWVVRGEESAPPYRRYVALTAKGRAAARLAEAQIRPIAAERRRVLGP